MEYKYLGKTGMKVSELCLGAMTFGREADEETSHRMMDRFVEAGGNFIDTADVYSRGLSEEIVGNWMQSQNREDLVIATKVRGTMGPGPNDVGLSRKHIMAAVEASLTRLQTDYIDLYQVHSWVWDQPLEETLDTLNDLVRSGLVRYIGASNYSGWQLQKAVDLADQMGWEPFVCLQPLYNLLDRDIEIDIMHVCRNEGIGIIPWSPLRGGWLAGKYRRGVSAPIEGTRIKKASEEGWSESWSAYDNERTWNILDVQFAIAEELDKSPAQVALNWLLQQSAVTAPIIGARTMEQLEDNLGAAGWALSEEQMARLNAASEQTLPYPYAFIGSGPLRK